MRRLQRPKVCPPSPRSSSRWFCCRGRTSSASPTRRSPTQRRAPRGAQPLRTLLLSARPMRCFRCCRHAAPTLRTRRWRSCCATLLLLMSFACQSLQALAPARRSPQPLVARPPPPPLPLALRRHLRALRSTRWSSNQRAAASLASYASTESSQHSPRKGRCETPPPLPLPRPPRPPPLALVTRQQQHQSTRVSCRPSRMCSTWPL